MLHDHESHELLVYTSAFFGGTSYAYPQRDIQAELTWVVKYQGSLHRDTHSSQQCLTWSYLLIEVNVVLLSSILAAAVNQRWATLAIDGHSENTP